MSDERLAIAGSGAIACGLAVVAAKLADVHLHARSDASAERARASIDKQRARLGDEAGPGAVTVTTEWSDLADATFFVEAVAEEPAVKGGVLGHLDSVADDDAIIATTTSSLSVSELAVAGGRPDRFVGLHVFNPVPRMQLIELAFPRAGLRDDHRPRDRALRGARQDGRRRPGLARLRRQQAAVPLPLLGRRLHGAARDAARGRRRVHEARRRPSDGPAGADRLRRPRRRPRRSAARSARRSRRRSRR